MVDINNIFSSDENEDLNLDDSLSDENQQNTAKAVTKKAPAPAKSKASFGFMDKLKGVANPDKNVSTKAVNKIDLTDASSEQEEPSENSKTYRGEPLVTVITRNRFYRDGYRNLIKIAIAEAVIIVLLIISFIAYMGTSKSEDRYFATTADGRIMKMVPLDRANMSTSALMSWVAQSATEVMTFGFHDYQTRLQKSSRHFTRQGWEGFTRALQNSKIIDAVLATSQVVTCKPRSAPVLIQEGVFNGKYRWVVDLPLQVNYQSGQKSRTDNLMVRMVIDRVTSLENPYGVGIEQWIAKAN